MFSSLSHRRASSSSSRSSESWSEDSSAQWSSESSATSEVFDFLEPISSRAPQELAFLDSTSYVTKECNSAYVASLWSSNKIPQCPKHGIQHNPSLSLPERDSRSFETIFSSFKSATSRSGSASSSASASASRRTPSRRGSASSSIKCYVRRAVSPLIDLGLGGERARARASATRHLPASPVELRSGASKVSPPHAYTYRQSL